MSGRISGRGKSRPAPPLRRATRHSDPAELERKILELERTVQLLEEARSHYADHYDFAPFGCVTLDDHGCILELNVTAARLLGKERMHLIGVPLLPFVEKACMPTFLNHLRLCRSAREKNVCEINIGPPGRKRPLIEFLSVPVIDTHTGQTVSRSVLRDISDRRRTERALRQSEERFAIAFRASPSAIAITSLEDGRFLDVNASFCKITGFSRKETIGHTSIELGFHADETARDQRVADLQRAGTIRGYESQVRTKSGAMRDFLIAAELIELEGRPCVLMIGQDVTEIKQLQREVLEIGEREQSRIGQDLHDGPCQSFTGLAMLAEVIARDLDRDHPLLAEKVRDLSRMVRDSADEMRQLAAGLFPVKVGRDGLAWALEDLAAETSVRCEIPCTFTMSGQISIADKNAAIHLYRIAQEAVNNAVRHSRARHIAIDLSQVDGSIRLSISDDGVGILRASAKKHGIGLHSMQYRTNLLGGSFEACAAGKRGTKVLCVFSEKKLGQLDEKSTGKEANLHR